MVTQSPRNTNFKTNEPKGIIYKPDEDPSKDKKTCKGQTTTESSRTTLAETEIKDNQSNGSNKKTSEQTLPIAKGVMVNYVHFGPTETFEYSAGKKLPTKLKPVSERPKTPMPSQQALCKAGFSEEKLKEVLPTLSDFGNLKEKAKFRKAFKDAALQLFKRSIIITENAYNPTLRIRTINRLVNLGDIERPGVVQTLCSLLMNKPEKVLYESKEFDWISRTLAREAINEVLKPPEFQRVKNDNVARTKIMFYKPRQNKKKI